MDYGNHETHVCPKCGRLLMQSGEVPFDDMRLAVFSCDECLVDVDCLGETTRASLTFTLDENGQIFDATAPDARMWF